MKSCGVRRERKSSFTHVTTIEFLERDDDAFESGRQHLHPFLLCLLVSKKKIGYLCVLCNDGFWFKIANGLDLHGEVEWRG